MISACCAYLRQHTHLPLIVPQNSQPVNNQGKVSEKYARMHVPASFVHLFSKVLSGGWARYSIATIAVYAVTKSVAVFRQQSFQRKTLRLREWGPRRRQTKAGTLMRLVLQLLVWVRGRGCHCTMGRRRAVQEERRRGGGDCDVDADADAVLQRLQKLSEGRKRWMLLLKVLYTVQESCFAFGLFLLHSL